MNVSAQSAPGAKGVYDEACRGWKPKHGLPLADVYPAATYLMIASPIIAVALLLIGGLF